VNGLGLTTRQDQQQLQLSRISARKAKRVISAAHENRKKKPATVISSGKMKGTTCSRLADERQP
jgi:hypothetical protein